jgi:hypothetical protein
MKKSLFILLTMLACAATFGQGTVTFGNRNGDTITHIWWSPYYYPPPSGPGINDTPPGTTDYATAGYSLIGANGLNGTFGAATTLAQLLAANGANQPESSLLPVGETTSFRTGQAAGNLVTITTTLSGIPKGSPVATFEVVVWDNSSGLYSTWTLASIAWLNGMVLAGKSGTFNVENIGGDLTPFPPVTPIPTFAIGIPEPSTVALAILGGGALAILRRRK